LELIKNSIAKFEKFVGFKIEGLLISDNFLDMIDNVLPEVVEKYNRESVLLSIASSFSGVAMGIISNKNTNKVGIVLNYQQLNKHSITADEDEFTFLSAFYHELGHFVQNKTGVTKRGTLSFSDELQKTYDDIGYPFNEQDDEFRSDFMASWVIADGDTSKMRLPSLRFEGHEKPDPEDLSKFFLEMVKIKNAIDKQEAERLETKSAEDIVHAIFEYGGGLQEIVSMDRTEVPEGITILEDEFEKLEAKTVERGGPGSGHKGHVGRKGEVGGSAPEGTPAPSKYGDYASRPGYQVYGTEVFTPMLRELVYGWQDKDGWGVAEHILAEIEKAQKSGDDSVQGLALGSDGMLVGIAALDYESSPINEILDEWKSRGIESQDMLRLNGMFVAEKGHGEEVMLQVAIEAAAHNKGVWAVCGKDSLAWYAQMGFNIGKSQDKDYVYLSSEDIKEVAETFTMPEQLEYVAPSSKPRWTVKFDDAFDESVPENPVGDEPPPPGVDQMDFQERYRWESLNYGSQEMFDPEQWARETLEYDEEEHISSLHDVKTVEDVTKITEGWIDGGPTEGSDNMASIRFSEGVANVFGGTPIPEERVLDEDPVKTFDSLVEEYGEDVVLMDYVDRDAFFDRDTEEIADDLIEFIAFTQVMREDDLTLDTNEFAQKIYDQTQAKLKEAGFQESDTVRLYRGLRSTPETRLPEGADGGWIDSICIAPHPGHFQNQERPILLACLAARDRKKDRELCCQPICPSKGCSVIGKQVLVRAANQNGSYWDKTAFGPMRRELIKGSLCLRLCQKKKKKLKKNPVCHRKKS